MTKLKWLIVVFVLIIFYQGNRITRDTGVFTSINPQAYGQCKKVNGPQGSEDITIDQKRKVAFISAGNGREVFDNYRIGNTGKIASGNIWLLDLSDSNSEALKLNVEINGPFHPHGIDLLQMYNGERELYVVNHPSFYEHEILIFTVDQKHNLTLKRRISYPELISPNDIRAIKSDQFFVTNDHGSPRSSAMYKIEDYLGLSRTSVTYFDGSKGSFVITGLKSANGITLSEDQQTLYVSEATARRVTRFERGDTIKDWNKIDSIFVDSAVDNLEWDDQNKLLTGAHPKLFDLLKHAVDPAHLSPSHVLRINVDSTPMTFETLYMNEGEELSGSSVGAMLNGELLIGSVMETHFLRCNKN